MSTLFNSFWLAGFESACHVNRAGQRLDMLAVTQHDRYAASDYARLARRGIRTVRDGVRWHLIDHGGIYDFRSLLPMVKAAARHEIQVIWDICHYGWPDTVDVFAPAFVDRYARFCKAVARIVADHDDAIPFYTPINEISFLVWAIEHGIFYPYTQGRADELKRQLVRAAIAGTEAIWEVDKRARIVYGEPIIHVVPPRDRPDFGSSAEAQRDSQFEVWDLLCGRMNPELGGQDKYLDIMGVNFYHANQWEYSGTRLRWEDSPRDARWLPFHRLLTEMWQRYQRPLFVGETSHFGVGRAPWIREIAHEVALAVAQGTPIEGICLYPILDRPDWDDLNHWHNSGLWDLLPDEQGRLRRVLNNVYASELRVVQRGI